MILFLFISAPLVIILSELYMKFRARKIYEFALTCDNMSIEKAHRLMREFWKWPLR